MLNLFIICSERSSAGGGWCAAQLCSPWNVLQYMRIPSTARGLPLRGSWPRSKIVGWFLCFAQGLKWGSCQNATQSGPTAKNGAGHPDRSYGNPQPGAETPFEVEYVMRQRPANAGSTTGRKQTGHAADQHDLDTLRPRQLLARCAQGSQQACLTHPLVLRTDQCGIQNQYTGSQCEQEQEFHCGNHLIDDVLNLFEYATDVDHCQIGIVARKHVAEASLGVRQMERGDPGLRHVFHRRRIDDHEEVDAQRAPLQLANTRDRHGRQLAGDIELQLIAQLQLERLGQTFFHRGFRLAVV